MSWNYRVMRREFTNSAGEVEEEFGIYEVYYDENGNPNGWAKEPRGITAESPEGLRWIHEKIAEALGKPVLDYIDSSKQEASNPSDGERGDG